jgi:hypothetical protein
LSPVDKLRYRLEGESFVYFHYLMNKANKIGLFPLFDNKHHLVFCV